VRSQQVAHINGGGAVDGADDADGGGLVEVEAEQQRQDQGAEDAELSCCTEQHHPGILQQRSEIGHGADADENQQREELVVHPGFLQHREHAVVGDHRRERQIGENRPGADGNEQHRFVFLDDRQIDQEAADRDHQE